MSGARVDVHNALCELGHVGMKHLNRCTGYHVPVEELSGDLSGELEDQPLAVLTHERPDDRPDECSIEDDPFRLSGGTHSDHQET